MENSYTLYLEINNSDLIFFVGKKEDQESFNNIFTHKIPLVGFENHRISDYEKVFNLIKENIFFIEKKFNYTFKEVVLILENFNLSFVNLSGAKKLNGSQILRENITYILNDLKSYVNNYNNQKIVLHIFNSKFILDSKKIENLPIGLFGDFYSHELSFILISKNDYKNLMEIFDKCNLKIKKILVKSFVKGVYLNDINYKDGTFFQIKINGENSKIFYFENNSLKFEQEFNFGSDIVIQDISKITSMSKEALNLYLSTNELTNNLDDNDFVDKEYFQDNRFRKIKKKLIYKIMLARIQEISELILFKNINLNYYNKSVKSIFLELNNNIYNINFENIFSSTFSLNKKFKVEFSKNLSNHKFLDAAYKLVHYGWKKEAIPISKVKKSILGRFFDALFN